MMEKLLVASDPPKSAPTMPPPLPPLPPLPPTPPPMALYVELLVIPMPPFPPFMATEHFMREQLEILQALPWPHKSPPLPPLAPSMASGLFVGFSDAPNVCPIHPPDPPFICKEQSTQRICPISPVLVVPAIMPALPPALGTPP